MAFFTYIAACNSNTAIYIGVTGDLAKRIAEHRSGVGSVHTSRYRIGKLVYFESHDTLGDAIARDRKLKRWRRAWKDALIEEVNPNWSDLVMEVSFL